MVRGPEYKSSIERLQHQRARSPRIRQSMEGALLLACWKAKGNTGLDASTGQYVDLIEAGIIDPSKVARVALEDASSVAAILRLTEATMSEVPDTSKEATTAERAM